jgi:inorganic pyrophosphatase
MRLDEIPTFADDGKAFRVVVESPRGSSVKLKYDRELGVMTLSRPLPTGVVYPHDWGFVPGTSASDGDPVDALIVSDGGTAPGVVVTCRPLGVLEVDQKKRTGGGRERNDRIIAVPESARRGHCVRRQRRQGPGMERAVTGHHLDWRPLALPLLLCRTLLRRALLAAFVDALEYGSQSLQILRRQVRGQALGHYDCVAAHLDAFGCRLASRSLCRLARRTLCGFFCTGLTGRGRRCSFIDTCWFHWRVGRIGIGHGSPRLASG